MEDFIEYYENHHAKLGAALSARMIGYKRTYLRPIPDLLTGEVTEPAYDVITECRFASRESFEENGRLMQSPEAVAALIADEENLFDRSVNRRALVEEYESELGDR